MEEITVFKALCHRSCTWQKDSEVAWKGLRLRLERQGGEDGLPVVSSARVRISLWACVGPLLNEEAGKDAAPGQATRNRWLVLSFLP